MLPLSLMKMSAAIDAPESRTYLALVDARCLRSGIAQTAPAATHRLQGSLRSHFSLPCLQRMHESFIGGLPAACCGKRALLSKPGSISFEIAPSAVSID